MVSTSEAQRYGSVNGFRIDWSIDSVMSGGTGLGNET